ncbi:MAG: hypothetical protein ACI9C4_002445, partial [Paraglaciecola sp.]
HTVIANASSGAKTVKVAAQNGKSHLTVDGAPYQIKGVGLAYQDGKLIRELKAAGGNTFRTWGVRHLDEALALAAELDIMVAVGLETGKELQGFDYNDSAAVLAQYQKMTNIIDKYKNHANVLLWVIANEPNLLFDDKGQSIPANPKVYDALANISDYIQQHDGNHPVTVALAGANKNTIHTLLKHAPQIDIISVQLYGDLSTLPQAIDNANVNKPFMVTEFGPKGHWEVATTSWNREIEEPSALKAAGMAQRMQSSIMNDPTGKVIGGFAFLWGQKQERTPTWYGMFNVTGEHDARVDELTKMWTGKYPENRAPLARAIFIDGQTPADSVKLKTGQLATAKLIVSDPELDPLTTRWEFMQEVGLRSQGGHFEAVPPALPVTIKQSRRQETQVEIEFLAPKALGEYRLFAYTFDGHKNVANANIPFMVVK